MPPYLDRSSVRRVGDCIVILTPEGQRFTLSPERAIEWTTRRTFVEALKFAALDCPAGTIPDPMDGENPCSED